MKKIITFLLLTIIFKSSAQLLPNEEVKFQKFEAWEKVGDKLLGKKIKSGNAITKIKIWSTEDITYIDGQSSLLGEFIFKVNMTENLSENSYLVEVTQLIDNSKSKFILNYNNNILSEFNMILPDNSATFKFFNEKVKFNKALKPKKCYSTADFVDPETKTILHTKADYKDICIQFINDNNLSIWIDNKKHNLSITKNEFIQNGEYGLKVYKATTFLNHDKYEIVYVKDEDTIIPSIIWIVEKYLSEYSKKMIIQFNKD